MRQTKDALIGAPAKLPLEGEKAEGASSLRRTLWALQGAGGNRAVTSLVSSRSHSSAVQRAMAPLDEVALQTIDNVSPESAQSLLGQVQSGPGTLLSFGPRRCLIHLLREIAGGSSSVERPELEARSNRYVPLVLARPDGYLVKALSGEAIQKAGMLGTNEAGTVAVGPYEVGAFYYSDAGVIYRAGPDLSRTGPSVGELGLEHNLVDKVLDGAEDAVVAMAKGLKQLITHPIKTISDLANLPAAVWQLIVNAPDYWEQFSAMPLGDQVQKVSEIITALLMTYGTAVGSATRIAAAAGDLSDVTINVLRLQGGGTFAVAQVAVPVGTVATALSGGPGGIYVLAMANQAAGGSGANGGGGGAPKTTKSGLPLSDPVNTTEMSREAVKRCISATPGERASLYRVLKEEIAEASKGGWSATESVGTRGETIFIGGQGRTLVFTPEGDMWVGDISHCSPTRLPSGKLGFAPDYSAFKAIK